ncbi:MAG: acetyltransferase [Cloacibacterium sp.]|jgi:sugar O-acyltransferase (sialic acid O-acetyltransferase NeuD family)|nr:acetyltransferase [Cloacibacterium sp.]
MLIIGAKGFAKEVLEIFHQKNETENLCFYDDVNSDVPDKLFNQFTILKSLEQAESHFKTVSNNFVIGIGNPQLRKMIYEKFSSIGGRAITTISNFSEIGSFDNKIEEGVIITSGVIITNSVSIGKCTLINLSSTIGHDTIIEDFVEICPNVSISGNCTIGEGTFIGTGATVLPKIKIGKNVVVAAGSVVTKDIPSNSLVAGVPAVFKKNLT